MVVDIPRPHMTVEEFAAITEDGKFDLVDGEVWYVSPTQFNHGETTPDLSYFLSDHVRRHKLGRIYSGEFGFRLHPGLRTVLCPDVSFVRAERVPRRGSSSGFFQGSPDLAVEVISPSERPADILAKVGKYLDHGTSVVWCVYPDKELVVVHAIDEPPLVLHIADTLTGGSVLPDFALPLATLFEE